MLSLLEPILKGKGDALGVNSYRGVKFLELSSCMEKVLNGQLHKLLDITKLLHGFISGEGTFKTVFILRRPLEKFRLIIMHCFLCLLIKNAPKCLVNVVMSLYQVCESAVSVERELSDFFL